MACCCEQASTFAWSDAFCSGAERVVAAHAYFHEHQDCTIAHDQIDLAQAASVVAFLEHESLAAQKPQRFIFGLDAAAIHCAHLKRGATVAGGSQDSGRLRTCVSP